MALTQRQQTRLDFLKKTRPNDPEVKKLQKMASSGGTAAPVAPAPKQVSAGGVQNLANTATASALEQFTNQGPLDLSGAPKILQTGDIRQDRQRVEDAVFGDITRDFEQQKTDEIANAEQTLMNRGIPYDPNPNSLWGKTMDQITKNHDRRVQDARNQAIGQGNSVLSSELQGQSYANQAFVDAAMKQYGAPVDAAASLAGIYPGYQAGISQKKLTPAQIAALNRSNRGGGGASGGGGQQSGDYFGGVAP